MGSFELAATRTSNGKSCDIDTIVYNATLTQRTFVVKRGWVKNGDDESKKVAWERKGLKKDGNGGRIGCNRGGACRAYLGLNSHMEDKGTMDTTADILKRVQETLETTKLGLKDLVKGPNERKFPGLRNLVVFGRSTTFVLQNLRKTEPERDFDNWYAKYQDEMKSDPLMAFFHTLRNEIEKEGQLRVYVRGRIERFSFPADMKRFGPPPPNAGAFFIGDVTGGSGWEIKLPDGPAEKYYVQLLGDIGSFNVYFAHPPTEHLGLTVSDAAVEALCSKYVAYLEKLVSAAKERFGSC